MALTKSSVFLKADTVLRLAAPHSLGVSTGFSFASWVYIYVCTSRGCPGFFFCILKSIFWKRTSLLLLPEALKRFSTPALSAAYTQHEAATLQTGCQLVFLTVLTERLLQSAAKFTLADLLRHTLRFSALWFNLPHELSRVLRNSSKMFLK